MKKFTSQEIKKFVSKPLFDEKVILNKDLSWPKISIITPSYNQGQFLEKTILSILNQNYPNLEYIIIDGKSTDGSVEIIKKYEKYLAYWVSEKDNGQSHALNKGFWFCTGEFIGWQNSDDIYLPGAFMEFATIARKFPNYDIYYSNKINIDENDNKIDKTYYVPPAWPYIKYHTKYRAMTFCTQATFFRRSILNDVGYIDESLQIVMDTEFFLRCVLKRKRFFYVNSFWGAFRRHELSKTTRIKPWNRPRMLERNHIFKKYKIYHGKFLPIINSMLFIWRLILLLKSGNLKEYLYYKLKQRK